MDVVKSKLFVRSGRMLQVDSNSVEYTGMVGYYWSQNDIGQTKSPYQFAWALYLDYAAIDPKEGDQRYSGFPLRCLVR